MKKLFLLLVAVIGMGIVVKAQEPQAVIVPVDKQNLPGYTLLFRDADVNTITDALAERLQKQAGLKSGKSSGYVAYLGQHFPELGALNFDIYTKVENEGKKKDRLVKLTFIVTKGNLNPVTNASDPQVIENINKFLKDFVPYAKAYELRSNIDQLNKDLTSQQKSLDKLNSKKEKQEKSLKSLNDEIQKEMDAINQKKSDIDKANSMLRQTTN